MAILEAYGIPRMMGLSTCDPGRNSKAGESNWAIKKISIHPHEGASCPKWVSDDTKGCEADFFINFDFFWDLVSMLASTQSAQNIAAPLIPRNTRDIFSVRFVSSGHVDCFELRVG